VARAATLREPISGSQFERDRTEGSTRYRCVGVGAHRLLAFKIYAVSFCLEPAQATELLGRYAREHYPRLEGEKLVDRLEKDQAFFDALAAAPGDKLVEVRFLRDLSGKQLADSFRTSLARLVPADQAERVAAAIGAQPARKGESALIYSQGSTLRLRLGSQERVIEDVPLVTERIWRIWLGPNTPVPNLKRSLALLAAHTR
jgi:hypothetical protein